MLPNTISLIVFIACYILFVLFPTRRSLAAAVGAIALLMTGTLSLPQAFFVINWNVMGIFVGTLVVADMFMESRVPAWLAEIIVDKARNTAQAIVLICMLTGFISAFVENVATVLIVAPIALELARKLKINPSAMMIGIAVSSNLQGAATLIGDPPSMLLAGFTKMNFLDFFFYQGKPGIFFAVELGAMFSFLFLYFLYRHHSEKTAIVPVESVRSWTPTLILVLLIVALALSSFLDTGFSCMAGIMCMIAAVLCIVWAKVCHRASIIHGIKNLDWDTTFFLMGVFILVGSITETGWIERISQSLSALIGSNIFLGYTLLVFLAIVVSAFVDNVPFLAAMLPVALSMSEKLGISPSLLLFGLLIGASLGGNVTPIGATANIVACGLLKKEGYPVTFPQFMKIGIPFTVAAVLPASVFIWLVWG